MIISVLSLMVFLSLFGCSERNPAQPDPLPQDTVVVKDTVVQADYNVDSLPVSNLFNITQRMLLKNDSLREISGLVTSSQPDNSFFWAEEDSGNPNAIYLLDSTGRLHGTKYLKGVFNRDWEDMAGGPGPVTGKYYLYVGDIGDNLFIMPFLTVYRFEEPRPISSTWKDSLIHDFDVINLTYPDGRHNAEALMVDPKTKDIYVITKDKVAGLYVARYPQKTKEINELKLLVTLPVSTVTAADISRDGNRILIKNYDEVFYWQRAANETIASCLQRPPIKLKYEKEPQGEAIAWTWSGMGFYTLSEKVGSKTPVFYHYESFEKK